MRRQAAALPLLLTLALAPVAGGCSKHEDKAQATAPRSGESGSAELALDNVKQHASDARKVIHTARLDLETGDYEKARKAVDERLDEVGGYVAKANITHREGRVSRATLTLRIPSAKLQRFLRRAAGTGTVLSETLDSRDITDAYHDLDARLTNAKRLEARLRELMGTGAATTKDLLEVERELARVRGEIDAMEGKKRMFDKQVALSTVEMTIVARAPFAAGTPRSLTDEARMALAGSLRAMSTLGKGLLMALVMLLPWLPGFVAGFFGLRWVARRTRRKALPTPKAGAGA